MTAAAVFGIGVIVVIAGFFLLGFKHDTLNYWALGSLLFALIAAALVTLALTGRPRYTDGVFAGAVLGSITWIYVIIVVVSICFTWLFTNHVGVFILIEIVIHAAFLVLVIIAANASAHADESDARTYQAQQSGQFDGPVRGGY